jgi:hypothetical protein
MTNAAMEIISISSSVILRDSTASFNTTVATRANLNKSIGAKMLDECEQHSERQSIGHQDTSIIERGSYIGWPWFVKCVNTLSL